MAIMRVILKSSTSSILCHAHNFSRCAAAGVSTYNVEKWGKTVTLYGEIYNVDNMTSITPAFLSRLGHNLHNKKYHPLDLIRQRIVNYFYSTFKNSRGNPIFAVFDNMNPVVSTHQNFDSLLVPKDHVSRSRSETYYINKDHLLRAHTSAHQDELIRMGFDNFLVVGDVFRRDSIDSKHYPVFHQMEGVRLLTDQEVFKPVLDPYDLYMFEDGKRLPDKQEKHSLDAVKLLEHDLKNTLLELTKSLFGKDVLARWVDAYFPFTHPSWELEIFFEGDWLEVLGCGIIEQQLLENAGAGHKVGWAFGLGLERLAMRLYNIPDIRLFWSSDASFRAQFMVEDPATPIIYRPPSSRFPPCINDISFWLPRDFDYTSTDFYDLVRDVGGDLVEQVTLIDDFLHPKSRRKSHCYRIVYRHTDKILKQDEVNKIHSQIENTASRELNVEIR